MFKDTSHACGPNRPSCIFYSIFLSIYVYYTLKSEQPLFEKMSIDVKSVTDISKVTSSGRAEISESFSFSILALPPGGAF